MLISNVHWIFTPFEVIPPHILLFFDKMTHLNIILLTAATLTRVAFLFLFSPEDKFQMSLVL